MDDELRSQFDEYGIEPSAEVLAKSMQLCIDYRIDDAAEFVEQWTAFSVSHLGGAEPNNENLGDFERKFLQAKRDKDLAAAAKRKSHYSVAKAPLAHLSPAAANPLAMYGITGDADEDDGMMEEYMGESGRDAADAHNVCRTPTTKRTFAGTPARPKDALFSPASHSPSTGTPRSHAATAAGRSGKIVYTFGNPALIGSGQWRSQHQPKIHLRQLLLHDGAPLRAAGPKYMFDNLREKSEILGDRIFHIGKSLCRRVFGADAKDFDLNEVDNRSEDLIRTIGMVCCDHDGRLDQSSTLLMGSDEAECHSVRLNFSAAQSVALFPGQVVMAAGVNPKAEALFVREIHAERVLEPPAPPKFADQLSFVIAAGPYTQDEDLVYDPLLELTTYLKDSPPDVLILSGPFLDAEHKLISENATLTETFESFFEKMIAGIVDAIGPSTTLLVVTSHRDIHADPVYPTLPVVLKKAYPNVHILPDPSMVDLNGILVGMTATDIVDHLLENEFVINGGDKVKRVVNYLLHQGSFYPLNPPVEDRMCYDSALASRYANIAQVPHILILPSDQKCFMRMVNGCLAINPGRLTGPNGGTFARFIITPPAPKDEDKLFNYIGCQVCRV